MIICIGLNAAAYKKRTSIVSVGVKPLFADDGFQRHHALQLNFRYHVDLHGTMFEISIPKDLAAVVYEKATGRTRH